MIKTKIADIFIKDNNFSDPNYIKITNTEQTLLPEDYPELAQYDDYLNQTISVNTLSYNQTELLFSNYKQCKVLNTTNNNIDFFQIYEKTNSRGELHRTKTDKTTELCVTNISAIESFKSYLACYLNNNLIIVHSDLNSKVEFTKISQNENGVYQKLKFTELNGNYKVISINEKDNIIYVALCDNITTYFYKITDYVLTLVKTITENILFQEQKFYTLNKNGCPNLLYNDIILKNENKLLYYNILNNTYSIQELTLPSYDEAFNFFENYYTIKNVIDTYFTQYVMNYRYNTNYFNVECRVKNPVSEFLSSTNYQFTNYLEDIALLNFNLNAFIIFYRANDNTTKLLYRNNTFSSGLGTLTDLASITQKIKNCSYVRFYDDLFIFFEDENSNIYKLVINIVYDLSNQTTISIQQLTTLNNNHSYYIKTKN